MKSFLLLGTLFGGWCAPAAWAQASLPEPTSALPRTSPSFQHLDPGNGTGPVTLDLRHGDETYLLELEPYALRARDFRVLLDDGFSRREIQPPASATYRGRVHDARGQRIDGAHVVASRTSRGWVMSVTIPGLGDTLLVQPALDVDPTLDVLGLHAVYGSKDVDPVEGMCADGAAEPSELLFEERDATGDPPILAATSQPTVRIAFDADVEYYQLLGSDVAAVVADIESLMNLVERVYERDARVTFEVTTIVVRTTPVGLDPYTATTAVELLREMETHWNDRQGGIQRAAAHLVTGKTLTGPQGASNGNGIIFGDVLCQPREAYSVSQSRFTTNVGLRVALLAHHLGHNFGARHCDGSLQETERNCHIMCSVLNGCDGIGRPSFGSPARGMINRGATTAGCNHPEPAPLALPFVDDFPSDPPDPNKWLFNDKADVVARANVAEPSEPASLKLNANKDAPGYQDDIRTLLIDASGASALTLSFMSQRKGVEAGEELVIDYVASGTPGWTELARLTSDGVSQADFDLQSFDLPPDALHRELRIRLRIEANRADDRWFVDDLVLGEPPTIVSGPRVEGDPFPLPLTATGAFPGSRVAFFCSLTGAEPAPASGWTTGTGSSGLRLGLSPPVGLLALVEADAHGRATTHVLAPPGTPPTEVFVQAVLPRPLTPGSGMSEVLPLRIGSDPGTRLDPEGRQPD